MNEPILVSGDDLERVCADIRARGGVVSALETGVGNKNSQYRVIYFLGAPEREARAVEIEPRTPEKGSNPLASTNFSGEADSTSAGHASTVGVGSAPTKNVPVAVVDVEHTGKSIYDRMERVRLKAIESGRVTKPSRFSPTREARLPHND